jgi:hypothetical protein
MGGRKLLLAEFLETAGCMSLTLDHSFERRRQESMKSIFNTAIVLGAAFLASGLIRLAVRGIFDPDLIVGGIFLVSGLVMRFVRK